MIPKGLKVGDTFTEGKQTFVVLAVHANGSYDAKATDKAPEVKRGKPKKA